MKRFVLSIAFLLCLCISSYATEDFVDGYALDSFEIVDFAGMGAPPVSASGQSRIYHDSGDENLKLSEDGGAYANILSAADTDVYVPYTGATATLDLGAHDFTTTGSVGIGITPTTNLHVAHATLNENAEIYHETYSTSGADYSRIRLRHSLSNTLGTLTETDNTSILGSIYFSGVNSSSAWSGGARIYAVQNAASGATYIPGYMALGGSSATTGTWSTLYLSDDDKVGIRVADPTVALDVLGDMLLTGNSTTTGNIRIDSDSSVLDLGDTAGDYTIGWDGSDAGHTITAGDFVFTGGCVELPGDSANSAGTFVKVNNDASTALEGEILIGSLKTADGTYTLSGIWMDDEVGITPTFSNYNFLYASGAIFNTPASTPMSFRINNVDKMILDANGNFGVGIDAVARLHTYEDNSKVGDSTSGITIEQAGVGDAQLALLLTGVRRWRMYIDNSDDDKLKFAPSGNEGQEVMTIDTSGNTHFFGSLRLTSGLTSAPTNDGDAYIYRANTSGGSYPFDGFGNLVLQPGTSNVSNDDIVLMTGTGSTTTIPRVVVKGVTGYVGINEPDPQDTLEVNGTGLFKDKVKFTQDDGNEYIDSLNDGYMDYYATTQHRFNTDIKIGTDIDVDWGILFGGDSNNGGITYYEDFGRFALTDGLTIVDPGSLLATPVAGTFEFDDDRMYLTNVSVQRVLDTTCDVITATTTVADTITQTTIYTSSIPADSLKVGNFIKQITMGTLTTESAADVVVGRVKIGGATIATITSAGSGTHTDQPWHFDVTFTVREVGATAEIAYHIDLELDGTSSVDGQTDIDTTSQADLTVTVQWNNAKAGNILELNQGITEYKG